MVKKNTEKSFLKRNLIYGNFIEGWKYLKKIKIYVWISVSLFFIAGIIGYTNILSALFPEMSRIIQEQILKSIEEIMNQTEGLGFFGLIGFIILNNIKTAFFGMVFGIFFAFVPIVTLVFNGYVLGFVAEKAINSPLNTHGLLILWKLFPHGIFEIPAVLISIALGIRIGIFPFYIKNKTKGLLSSLVSLLIFLFSLSLFLSAFAMIKNPFILISNSPGAIESSYSNILENPVFSLIFLIIIPLCFIASLLVGLKILQDKDRKTVIENIKNSFKTFIFIVIPLLVIAGIIEGALIWLIR